MEAAKEPKEAASACLDKIELDPEKYRIGHTKASKIIMIEFFFHCNNFSNFLIIHGVIIHLFCWCISFNQVSNLNVYLFCEKRDIVSIYFFENTDLHEILSSS